MESQRPSPRIFTRDAMVPGERGNPTVPCTYENCARLFHSDLDMRVHKQSDPNHAYCFKCKIDFDSRGELFIHKLTSARHFACPLCSMDFRSGGGRDCHIRTQHHTEKNIKCTGCQLIYKTAAALVKHVECNECAGIRTSQMLLEQHRREQIHSGLHERAMFGPMTGSFERLPRRPVTNPNLDTIPDDLEGGISLIQLSSGSEGSTVKAGRNPATGARNKKNKAPKQASEPTPLPAQTAPCDADYLTLEDILLKTLLIDEDGCLANLGEECPQSPDDLICFEVIDEPLDGSPQQDGHFGVPLMPVTELIRDRVPEWDPQLYFDQNKGEYVCNCGYGTAYQTQFEYHMAMEQRWITTTQCLECGKIFTSTAALVAHMEQVRTRCKIRETRHYARAMGNVTGGLCKVEGTLPDGTDRIIARKLESTHLLDEMIPETDWRLMVD